ncbi:MAG: DUF6055 domain-containing protein, partial [Defluviitaleaceae bacterium]|nr:DUF6055 domain-containing protein [Defluviitaleaceae bacterium]
MKKRNAKGLGRITAWILSLIMIFAAFPLTVFAGNADLEEATDALDFPTHWTQANPTTLAQGNIARIATATAQHTNGGNTPNLAINGTIPTAAGNNHWNSWGAAANVGSQESPIWFQLAWDRQYEIDGLRVMWHIFTDAGVRWPNAANVQFMNAQGQWENVFPYTPLPNNAARVGVADPNSPIGVDANSGTNPANRPWPAPATWARNSVWNIVEFPETITTNSVRLQIYGAKTGGNAPGVGIAALEVFTAPPSTAPVGLASIGEIVQAAGDLYVQSALRAGAVAFDAPATWYQDRQVLLRWYRGTSADGPWAPIPGAVGQNYIITTEDTGSWLRVGAYSNGPAVSGGPVYSVATGPILGLRPAELISIGNIVQVTGNLHRDSVLRAGVPAFDVQSHPTYVAQVSYQWYRGIAADGPWMAIAGATGRDYTITIADEGAFIRLRAYPDGPYVFGDSVFSAAVGPILGLDVVNLVSIGNIAQRDGHINTYARLRTGVVTFSPAGRPMHQANVVIQWYRGISADGPWTAIADAIGRDYKIAPADTGFWLRASAHSIGEVVAGGPVHTAVVGPIVGAHQNMCITDGCFRLNCMLHCNTCGLIARLCLASDCEEHHNANKITLVNFTGLYRQEASIETEHFILTWQHTGQWAEFGRPDDPRVRQALRLELEAIAEEIDKIFEFIRDDLGYGSPYVNHRWDTHRMRANLVYDSGWSASGGTTTVAGVTHLGNITQSVWPSRPQTNPITRAMEFPTFVHEVGHAFQLSKPLHYPQSFGGGLLETLAQFKVWQMYPHWFHYEHHGPEFMSTATHLGFQHTSQLFRAPMVFMYWAELHGQDIMGRLSRNSTFGGTNVIETYKAYFGIDQAQFNAEIFEASRRFVTWDLDHVRDVNARFITDHRSAFTRIGDWHRIAANRVPNSYGYNAIRLNVPAYGTEVTADFRGLDHTYFPITEARRHLAGWHYGFLAKTADGTRHYGDMFSASFDNPETSGSFVVPEDTRYLWLVVTGAPTEHWTGAAASAAENWGYQIRLTGATMHSQVTVTCTDCGRTPCLSPCADAACNFACCVVCNPFLVSAQAPADLTLTARAADEAAAIVALTTLVGTIDVATSNPAITALPVVWTLANADDTPFNPGFEQTNTFRWTATLGHVTNPNNVVITGTILVTNPAAPTFTLSVFNNGNDNNTSLAGTIRMWTQLNGANANVPYVELEVEAVFPDGTCAMAHVTVNRIWNNQGYVNMINVNKNAPWQRIYFTAALFGQEVNI